jgi:uncharacterized protein with HEPN domain
MTNAELKYLEDVLLAINDIDEIIGEPKLYANFINNKATKYSIERQFEIIGEAIKNFKKLNSAIEISYSKEIIGLRNLITHAYDSIDYPKIWAIVINNLPELKEEVKGLIKKFE